MSSKLPEPMVNVFVYGTLKEGFPLNHEYMVGAKKVGDDALNGYILVTYGQYPVMGKMHIDGDVSVLGEVWQVPEPAFDELKFMEESVGYRTEDVVTATGQKAKTFVFFDVVGGAYSWQKTHDEGHSMRLPIGKVVITSHDDLPF